MFETCCRDGSRTFALCVAGSRVAMLKTLVLVGVATGWAQSVTDRQTLDQAQALVQKYCPVESSEINYEESRKTLELSAGNGNIVYDVLLQTAAAVREGETQNLASVLQDTVSPIFAIRKATPLLMAVLLWVVWHFACWFICCPCCMRCCCCCCQAKWKFGRVLAFQLLLWTSFALLAAAVVSLCAMSAAEHESIEQGIQGTGCYSAQLLQDAVAGSRSLNFVGLVPAWEALDELSRGLDPNSSFLEGVRGLLDATVELERAVNLVRDMLVSLQLLLDNSHNQNPPGYLHSCAVCEPLSIALVELVGLFDDGVALAMNTVRREVEAQLDGERVGNLRRTIQEAKEPVETMKEQMLQQLGYFVKEADDGFQKGTEALAGESSILYFGFLGVLFLAILVVIVGFLALTCYSSCHRGGEEPDPCVVRVSSGSSMCASYIFAGTLFLIGGILLLVSMVGGGVCLAMVDFDQQTGETLLESLGVPTDDSIRLALKLADQCMSLKSDIESNATRNVADILELPDPFKAPGTMSSLRRLMSDYVVSQINGVFELLELVMANQPLRLADNPILTKFRGYVRSVNMKAMFWPLPTDIADHPVYSSMPIVFYPISILCDDLFLPSSLPEQLANVYAPGLDSMVVDGIATGGGPRIPGLFDDQSVTWDCPSRLEGDCSGSNYGSGACEAAKAFVIERKLPLLTQPLFRCRYLQKPGAPAGTRCDVEDMYKVNGSWINSCVHPNNTVTFFEQTCNITEFEENVRSFDLWFYRIFQYMDDIVEALVFRVADDLRALVYLHLVDPVFSLLDQLDCSFMQNFWKGLTDSLCFRAVSSFQVISSYYVWVASLALVMVGVMYIAWRISRDTADAFDPSSHTVVTRAIVLRNKVKQRIAPKASRTEVDSVPDPSPDPETSESADRAVPSRVTEAASRVAL